MPRRSSFVASVLAFLSCLLSGAWAQDCAEGYGATVRLSAALHNTLRLRHAHLPGAALPHRAT